MTVHLNSLLGGFAGLETQAQGAWTERENVYARTIYHEGEGFQLCLHKPLVGRILPEACVYGKELEKCSQKRAESSDFTLGDFA